MVPPVFLQKVSGGYYRPNMYGMFAGNEIKGLENAKKEGTERVRGFFDRGQVDIEELKDVFNFVNRKGGVTRSEYREFTSQVNIRKRKQARR